MSKPNSSQSVIETHDDQGVIDAVSTALQSGRPLVDYGVGHSDLGQPPPPEHTALRQSGHIIEHYQRDLTVRVAAGCTMGELNEQLGQTGQLVPIDADDDLTIGEVVQHNVYGPLRLAYGIARDLILGLSFIDGKGRLNKVGGRTVKNVAGYDMTRFMVGAMGEMGVVTELTLRTYALPTHTLAVSLSIEQPELIDAILPNWLLTDAAPTWISLTTKQDQLNVHASYFGKSSSCMKQLRSLETFLEKQSGLHIVATREQSFAEDQDQRCEQRLWRKSDGALVKVIVPPASSGFVCQALLQRAADNVPTIDVLPGHGCIFFGGRYNGAQARQLDEQINRIIAEFGGLRIWHRRPDAAIEPFAPRQSDWSLLGKLKNTLDPHGLLNPGRFLPVGEPVA